MEKPGANFSRHLVTPVKREEVRTPTKNRLPIQYSFNTNLTTMKKADPSFSVEVNENESRHSKPNSANKPTMLPKDLEMSDNEIDDDETEDMEVDLSNVNIQTIIYQPPPGTTKLLQCKITRQKTGINGSLHPTYYLHLEKDNSKKRFLLAARKKKAAKGSYVISHDQTDINVNGAGFIGKLKSDLLGRYFTMHQRNDGSADKEIIAIAYENNAFGLKGPKKMNVLLPEPDIQSNLIDRLKESQLYNVTLLKNKAPSWNEEINSYQLNFNGRVKRASVKNFQIIHNNDDDVVLQFGKFDEEVFVMDYKHPFSALQAFAICLSSLDH